MKKINKKIFLIFAIIIVVLLGVIFLKPNETEQCQNQEQKIQTTLQSGEKGTVYITDNHCEFPLAENSNLSFKILDDKAIQDNLYGSKLYIWLRDSNLTVEEQVQLILLNQFQKKTCQIEKNEFSQHDDLVTYGALDDDCLVFGPATDLSSEIYMETNNLLIAQRQDGLDGIAPFDFASIKFIK